MDRTVEQLQQLQDTYAADSGICLLIADEEGRWVTRPSGKREWLGPLEEKKEPRRLASEALRLLPSLDGVSRPVEFEFRPGMKLLTTRLPGPSAERYYLWAVFFTDSRARLFLQSYYEGEESEGALYRELRDAVPELNGERKRRLSAKLASLASISGRLMETERLERAGKRTLAAIREAASSVDSPGGRVKDSLQPVFALGNGLDFIGYAAKEGETRFRITEVLGEGFSMIGSGFSFGEGFLGQTATTRQPGRWGNVSRDPRILFFRQNNVPIRSLFSFPVLREGELIGILFGGSRTLQEISDELFDVGQTLHSLIQVRVAAQNLRDERNSAALKLSMLMEIQRTVSLMQDVKRVLYLLIDMSLSLAEGSFAAALHLREDGKAQLVSRGLSQQQGEQTLQELTERYAGGTSDTLIHGEAVLAEWQGVPVLECPLRSRYEVYGVLLVALRDRHQAEEHRSYLESLALTASGAIHRIRQEEQSESREQPSLLHLAMKQWAPEAYERGAQARELAVAFARAQEGNERVERLAGAACLLAEYDPVLVQEQVEPELAEVLFELKAILLPEETAESKLEKESIGLPEQAAREASQIAALALQSIQPGRKLNPGLVEEALAQAFQAFLVRRERIDLELTLGQSAYDRDEATLRVNPLLAIRDLTALSSREQEVLSLVATGASNREVAETLFISEHTVKNHMTNIFHKLGVNDRSQLIAWVYQLGYQQAGDLG